MIYFLIFFSPSNFIDWSHLPVFQVWCHIFSVLHLGRIQLFTHLTKSCLKMPFCMLAVISCLIAWVPIVRAHGYVTGIVIGGT